MDGNPKNIADILNEYEAARSNSVIAVTRLASTCRTVVRLIGHRPLLGQRALALDVTEYGRMRQGEGVSSATVRRELITLRAAIRLAWKTGALDWHPYVALPGQAPSRQRWLTQAEAQRLLDHLDGAAWLAAVIMLLSGARIGAVIDLTWDRVDLPRRSIDFRNIGDPQFPRRKHRAVVPIPEAAAATLERARCHRGDDDRVIPRSQSAITRSISSGAQRAGLQGVTPHVLRHTVATWLIGDAKVPLIDASRLIGHKSTLITEQIYAHLVTPHLVSAARELAARVSLRP